MTFSIQSAGLSEALREALLQAAEKKASTQKQENSKFDNDVESYTKEIEDKAEISEEAMKMYESETATKKENPNPNPNTYENQIQYKETSKDETATEMENPNPNPNTYENSIQCKESNFARVNTLTSQIRAVRAYR